MNFCALGRRKADPYLMVNWRKSRLAHKANTAFVDAVELELIPDMDGRRSGSSKYKPGMVLIHRDWKKQYLVVERGGWTEEQYFELAEQILKRRGITEP